MIKFILKNKSRKDLLAYILLISFAAIIIAFIYKPGFLYGSKIDWINQHSVIPEYFRQLFYSTGNIFPDFAMNLGAGQNIYNLSYYGLYNPIILISYLFPFIPMVYYITASSIIIVLISVCLSYYWLRSKNFSIKVSFVVAFLFLCSGPLIFHSHKHIMFIDYYPFLFLALLGVDRYYKSKKLGLLILGIFLCIMTSYFFSVGCILTILIYTCYEYMQKIKHFSIKDVLSNIRFVFVGIFVAILMSAILWLPTLYTILNGRGSSDATKISILSLLIPNIKLSALLYHPYSLGLTSVVLIILIANLIGCNKKEKIYSFLLIILVIFPIILYILNGTLYVETKVIIPFIPLYLILIASGLTRFEAYVVNHNRVNPKKKRFIILTVFLFIMIEATISCLIVNSTDKLVPIQEYSNIYNQDKFSLIKQILNEDSGFYRMNDLTSVNNTQNLVYHPRYNQTSMYTSTFNSYYYKFYQNIFKNPASTTIPLVLNSSYNIYFQNFMNVKYIVAKDKTIAGYTKIDRKGEFVLYKNDNTMPIGYATNKTLSRSEFEKLKFPKYMGIFFDRIIIDKSADLLTDAGNLSDFNIMETIIKMNQENFENKKNIIVENKGSNISFKATENASLEIPLEFNLKDYILILSFKVSNKEYINKQAYGISINGILNEIPDKSLFDPNNDKKFVYYVSSSEKLNRLYLEFLKGEYEISDFESYIAPTNQISIGINQMDHLIVDMKNTANNKISGDILVKENGYFATTLPYDKGFKIIVDGKNQVYEKVNTAFVGFPIKKGNHHIVIKYEAPYKVVGLVVSSIGIFVFAGVCLVQSSKISGKISKEINDYNVN